MATDTKDPAARLADFRARRREGRASGRLMSAGEAADYTGWPYTTIRDMATAGKVPVVRIPGSRRMWFERADLDRAIAAWKERLA